MQYNHNFIEKKWQKYWEENKTFYTDVYDFSKPKFYALDMFPYPSAQGLHVGHPRGYTASDVISRMKRMQGYNVLHPMGWDSFGLPAEQFAILTGNHPDGFTQDNIKTFTRQLKMLGFSFDWSKQISTADPNFYKWTQWIFLQFFNDGLAKQIDTQVNWCEELGTVLANDEIIDGKSERGGYPVIKKNMKQWILDIPKYAEKLLEGLNNIDWPESTKEMQRNWIGKSTGANINFKVDGHDFEFTVFTTRPDTLFGATYCVLSPENKLVDLITTTDKLQEVTDYKKMCELKSEQERLDTTKEKTGVFTGSYAINPVNNELVPIFISDYVLANYGTGAIMAVPAHDSRDYAFAKKFNLKIVSVIEGADVTKEAFEGDGLHINSDFINGLNKEEAISKMISYLEEKKIGYAKTTYKLREWIFARQRYWGEPIPVVHHGEDTVAIPYEQLPLILPEMDDYKPKPGKLSPLDNATDWVNYDGGFRETSTMPGSAGSSWYFLRYLDPNNDKEIADKKLLDHWLPVDLYIGGSEHAVGHLLYSRFWMNYLHDKGLVNTKEPFKKLFHQGMILGENNEKMSKSKGNVVNPDPIVENLGADSLRLYEMFMGPLEASLPWSTTSLEGSKKFLDRVWRLYTSPEYTSKITEDYDNSLEMVYHQTVKKVTNDIESLNLNTAIAQMMIFVNEAYKASKIYKGFLEGFIKMLSCYAPHMGEEIWSILGNNDSIAHAKWPEYDEKLTISNTVEIVIQVNGKLRDKIELPLGTSKEETLEKSLASDKVKPFIDGKEVIKTIVVPNKLVNIVIKQ